MMKRNKLYTVTRFNRGMFNPIQEKLFPNGGALLAANSLASEQFGANYGDAGNTLSDYMDSTNAFGISKADNPFSKMNLKGGLGAMASTPIGGGLLNAGAGAIGGLANSALSGGLSSGAGSAISSIGSTIGGAVGAVNPLLGAAVTMGSDIISGGVNALFGSAVDEEKLNAAKEGTSAYNSFLSNASSFDGIQGPTAQANVQDAYRGGVFTSGSAKRKNEELKRQRLAARQFADRSILNNVNNLAADQMNNALANFSAFGGPIDTSIDGAIGYGFMGDYLTQKKKETEAKNKMLGISPMPAINTFGHGGCFNPFALGGDIEVHQDNTKVFRPMMLPIQRQQNFSDSEYFWDAGKGYPAGLWKHKDGTFHTTGSYGKDIVLTQKEADSIIRATKAKNRREKLRKAMENHKQNTYANGGQMYSVGQTYDVSEEEANRLKAMGYEFTVVS